MVIWLAMCSILSVITPVVTASKSCRHLAYHLCFQQVFGWCWCVGFWWVVCFLLPPTETFPFTSRIGSWPVEVLNANIYQYAINAFKSSFLLFWKRHCSHLTLEVLKMLGLIPEFYVQESCFWRFLTETTFPFFFSSEPFTKGSTQALKLHLFLPFTHAKQLPRKV